ncbi:ABC-three component system middle component 6 [Vibrio cholerae]|uniref:ABC-three component system middle component 6 n=1 Tax=Vibrio cholerae TaxID=666 RepID=UPI001D98FAA7|nr:hypothetical protein [Vibrio cholerae]EGR2061263.1 hypothetical protein [Vibrio cholerae]EGR2114200.1 hypothetical protein [Vibrio cholerae]EGR2243478.1 hypothetical protein [Vibrio cholerae]
MIISNHQSQKLSLIIVGANILKLINSDGICPLILFNMYVEQFDNITFTYFSYGLDWLFICGAINIDEFGNVKICY